ncbi:MAG: serine/threonine-protein kinase [Rouxiella badensis]|uniref:phosphotransferase n=1 Tax=Rouxiella badensis TaxID=1646377 RepID=UPI003C338269
MNEVNLRRADVSTQDTHTTQASKIEQNRQLAHAESWMDKLSSVFSKAVASFTNPPVDEDKAMKQLNDLFKELKNDAKSPLTGGTEHSLSLKIEMALRKHKTEAQTSLSDPATLLRKMLTEENLIKVSGGHWFDGLHLDVGMDHLFARIVGANPKDEKAMAKIERMNLEQTKPALYQWLSKEVYAAVAKGTPSKADIQKIGMSYISSAGVGMALGSLGPVGTGLSIAWYSCQILKQLSQEGLMNTVNSQMKAQLDTWMGAKMAGGIVSAADDLELFTHLGDWLSGITPESMAGRMNTHQPGATMADTGGKGPELTLLTAPTISGGEKVAKNVDAEGWIANSVLNWENTDVAEKMLMKIKTCYEFLLPEQDTAPEVCSSSPNSANTTAMAPPTKMVKSVVEEGMAEKIRVLDGEGKLKQRLRLANADTPVELSNAKVPNKMSGTVATTVAPSRFQLRPEKSSGGETAVSPTGSKIENTAERTNAALAKKPDEEMLLQEIGRSFVSPKDNLQGVKIVPTGPSSVSNMLTTLAVTLVAGKAAGAVAFMAQQFKTAESKPTSLSELANKKPEPENLFVANKPIIYQALDSLSDNVIRTALAEHPHELNEDKLHELYSYAKEDYAKIIIKGIAFIAENYVDSKIIKAIQQARVSANLTDDVALVDMLKDKKFIVEISKMLAKGEFEHPSLQACNLEKLMEPILSRTPVMAFDVELGLNSEYSTRLTDKIDSYFFPDGGAEVKLAAMKAINEKIKYSIMQVCQNEYSKMHEGVSNQHIFNKFGMNDYEYWYTAKGAANQVQDLSSSITDAELNRYILSAANNTGNGTPIPLNKYAELVESFNNVKANTVDYLKNFNINTLVDEIVLDEIRKIPTLQNANLDDIVSINDLTKKKDLSLKEVALGDIFRNYPSSRYIAIFSKADENKPYHKHDVNLKESLIKLADRVEVRLEKTIRNNLSRPDAESVVKNFIGISFKTQLIDYMKKASVEDSREFGPAINDILAGTTKPKLMAMLEYPMSNIIALKGIGERYLAVSTLTQESKIIPNRQGLENDQSLQNWLLHHLSFYDSQRNMVKTSFTPKMLDPLYGITHYEYPVKYSETGDYTSDLTQRHIDRLRSDPDVLIKTHFEQEVDTILSAGIGALGFLSVGVILTPASALGAFCSAAMGMGISAMQVAKYFVADTPDEKMDALFEAVMSGVFDTALEITQAIKLFRQQMSSALKSGLKNTPNNFSLPDSKINIAPKPADYRKAKPIAEGTAAKIYSVDDYLIKEFKRPLKEGDFSKDHLLLKQSKTNSYSGALREANNNAVAFNRLYGEGSSVVFIDNIGNSKIVSMKMPKIPGESLQSILKNDNLQQMKNIRKSLSDENTIQSIIDRTLADLKKNGIMHDDINLANIMFNPETDKFTLIDFDRARISPKKDGLIPELSASQMNPMEKKFKADLNEFKRSIDKLEKLENNSIKLDFDNLDRNRDLIRTCSPLITASRQTRGVLSCTEPSPDFLKLPPLVNDRVQLIDAEFDRLNKALVSRDAKPTNHNDIFTTTVTTLKDLESLKDPNYQAKFIFVKNAKGNQQLIIGGIGKKTDVKTISHPSLLTEITIDNSNLEIQSAGYIGMTKKGVAYLLNTSGHYKPTYDHLRSAQNFLKEVVGVENVHKVESFTIKHQWLKRIDKVFL